MKEVSELLGAGVELEGTILETGRRIREQSKSAYGQDLLDARLIIFGAWTLLLQSYNGVAGKTNQSISDRLTLTALALQGAPASETMISEGQYAKAAASLKQDMEVLVRLHETVAGVAKEGGAPQLKYLPVAGARRFYGELNDVAHPSNIVRLRELLALSEPAEGAAGVGPIPEFNRDIAVALYQLHIYLLFETLREVIKLMVEMYSVEEEPIQKAIRLVTQVGEMLEASGNLVREK